jgi:hypothetical protein
MTDTNVHDCAATGVYIGDVNSDAFIQRCNIVRNGRGTRPSVVVGIENLIMEREGSNEIHQLDNADNIILEIIEDIDVAVLQNSHNNNISHLHHELVPPGHSGMYFEASTATVKDCLIYRNSLTGLSVVRGGQIKISVCDLFENGSEPFTIEDTHDLLLGLGEGIRGGIEDLGGNSFCVGNMRHNDSSANTRSVLMRNDTKKNRQLLRQTRFTTSTNQCVTVESLQSIYS